MDPLSVTASIIAIVGLAENIISRCKAYFNAVKDAPNDLCNILIEVGSVKCILETLEIRRKASPILQEIGNVDGPLEGCDRTLKALVKLFPTESNCTGTRKRTNFVKSYAELAWPFKEGKARKLLEDLGRHKATLVLILTTDAGANITRINDNVEGIVDSLKDQERDSILRWLVKTDPSSNHDRACQLHEDHTGQWLVRSTEYKDWLTGPIRFLWLHGIPGAGKTILGSFLIQNVQQFAEASSLNDIGFAYYYCYFGRNHDESRPFLRWIISQLCRQLKHIPEELRRLSTRGTEPGYEDLLKALSTVVGRFRRVYIVIDALDESQDRKFLLDLLIKTVSDDAFENVRLLATSRKELDIQRAFEGICTSISLSNPLVDEDIRVYIEHELQTDRKFSRWPEFLKLEIRDALVRGAKGMFRWVACQLDILGRLNSKPDVRKALTELPETLEGTYERILAKIPPSNRLIAHKTLQLLAYVDDHEFQIDELAEAVIVDIDHGSFTTGSRLFDPMDLLEICTCLVTVDKEGVVRLAHYTVAEYLASDRILDGPAATFKISRDEASVLWISTLLIYLQNLPYDHMPTAKEFFSCDEDGQDALESQLYQDYPLMFFALRNWHAFPINSGLTGICLTELVFGLLDPRRDHFRGWEDQQAIASNMSGRVKFRLKCSPGAEISMGLAYICNFRFQQYHPEFVEALLLQNLDSSILENRLELCYDFLEYYPFPVNAEGTLLQVAAMTRSEVFTRILIRHGADPNARYQGWTVLTSTLQFFTPYGEPDYTPIVELLLQAGANANPPRVCKAPLQLAVEMRHSVDVVKLLLAAGVDANTVGDREAVMVDMDDPLRNKSLRRDSRSVESYYDTPLRIAEKKTNRYEPGSFEYRLEEERLTEIRQLLIQHGGISCHRSPQDTVREATCCIHPAGEGEPSPSALLPYGRR